MPIKRKTIDMKEENHMTLGCSLQSKILFSKENPQRLLDDISKDKKANLTERNDSYNKVKMDMK